MSVSLLSIHLNTSQKMFKAQNTKCQICLSSETIAIKERLYCKNCDIDYRITNSTQEVLSMPIKTIFQSSLNLCENCKEKVTNKKKITCKNFSEYFGKLRLCKSCRTLNEDFIRNLFYNNFLLYRSEVPYFGWIHSILLVYLYWYSPMLFEFSSIIGRSLLSTIGRPNLLRSALCFFYVPYHTNGLSYTRVLFSLLLLYHFGSSRLLTIFSLLYALIKILRSKTVIFEVPINLYSDEGLGSFINKLKISEHRMGKNSPGNSPRK